MKTKRAIKTTPHKVSFLKRLLKWACLITFAGILCVSAGYFVVSGFAKGRCFDDLDEIPAQTCGLVLGCVKKIGQLDNPFFVARVEAAAKLYHAGKVKFLLVSGDNFKRGYNEPADLKAALIAKGVPADRIYGDYAGFRTLDSVIRAKKVFGQDNVTIISQKFHNERALYMARRLGMPESVAFNAEDANRGWMLKMHLRESMARLLAIADVEILKTSPRFLGDPVAIGERTPPVDAVP